MRKCKSCKQELPDASFLKLTEWRWKVKICNNCARTNMARWAKDRLVGKKVAEYSKLR